MKPYCFCIPADNQRCSPIDTPTNFGKTNALGVGEKIIGAKDLSYTENLL